METESQLLQQVDQAMRERSEIEQAIQAYPDPHGRELLRLHYLCGKTFEQAAECMGISTRWAYSLHRAALEGIQI